MSINVRLSELYKTDFELTDIYAMRQKWKSGVLFTRNHPRKSNGVIYLNGCTGKYTDKYGNVINADRKSLIFLPESSEYSVLNLDCGLSEPDAYLVEFNIKVGNEDFIISDAPFEIECVNLYEISSLIEEIVNLYEASVRCPAAIKGSVYKLISILEKLNLDVPNDRYSSIKSGIELLEKNIYGDMSIKEIADACNVSEAHFRRLFKEYAKKSPIQYRIELKIENAKRMLEDSGMTLEHIAEALNFESTAYFCRLFKKKTGMTPSEYRKS